MKSDNVVISISILIVGYLLISVVSCLVGFIGGNTSLREYDDRYAIPQCLQPLPRAVTFFPSYKLGCYLGSAKGYPYIHETE